MEAIILAGGLGTRLQGVIPDLPKPMAPVRGIPFLAILLDQLITAGFGTAILAVGYRHEVIREYFKDSYKSLRLIYSVETEPLGTGGAIRFALKKASAPQVFVVNGDTYLSLDYRAMWAAHSGESTSLTVAVRWVPDAGRFGALEIGNGWVCGFSEKGHSGPGLINAGVYLISPDIFSRYDLPKNFSFENDLLVKHLSKLRPFAFQTEGTFIDIGIPEDYARAQKLLAADVPVEKGARALFLDRDGVINIEKNYVHRIEDFEFIEGIFNLCVRAQELGFKLVVITNQAGIARGYYTVQDYEVLTQWMVDQFSAHNVHIERVYYCPFHPTAGVGEYLKESFDRKPNPGMILRAREELDLDLTNSILIGDKDSDIEAGLAAGVGANLKLNYPETPTSENTGRTEFSSLLEINDWLDENADPKGY